MTNQPTMFGYADARTRQPALFDTDGPPAVTAKCRECGEYLERTPSGFLACPRGHGKLLTEAVERDDDEPPAMEWSRQAREIAKRHAARDHWHGWRWNCGCGACSRARLDGFIPRGRADR